MRAYLFSRPGGPFAKRQPSPEGLGINPEDVSSAVGAAPTFIRRETCRTRAALI
jgi:hypothetical protein